MPVKPPASSGNIHAQHSKPASGEDNKTTKTPKKNALSRFVSHVRKQVGNILHRQERSAFEHTVRTVSKPTTPLVPTTAGNKGEGFNDAKNISNLQDFEIGEAGKNEKPVILGEGSFGTVYTADHVETAEKMLRRQGFETHMKELESVNENDPESKKGLGLRVKVAAVEKDIVSRKEFRVEYDAINQIKKHPHPNIVQVLAVNKNVQVIRYENAGVDMEALMQKLAPAGQEGKGEHLNPTLYLSLMTQFAQGLAHLHENNMVHRDIKIENLAVAETGKAKIIDLGFLSYTDEVQGFAGTISNVYGEVFGAHSESPGVLKATDIYGLACSMIECLPGITERGRRFLHDVPLRQNPSPSDYLAYFTNRRKKLIKFLNDLERGIRLDGLVNRKEFDAFRTYRSKLLPLLRSMLNNNYNDRPQASEVVKKLQEIQNAEVLYSKMH